MSGKRSIGGVRAEVERLASIGSMPSEQNTSVAEVEKFQRAVEAITRPLSVEEAERLLGVFGPDSYFGLAWSLLHLIETAPELPIATEPTNDANEWIVRLWRRAHQ